MALTIADFDDTILPYNIIKETALSGSGGATATSHIDVTQGQNADNAQRYLKIAMTATTVVVGTTNADIVVPIPAGGDIQWSMPEGIDFTVLSMWCVTSEAVGGAAAPSAAVAVTLLTD
jgi:hypothetical protein